jgi:DNA-binding NarL/FixJ family response regulator
VSPLRLFLADDHEIVRYGLRTLVESQFGWTVVGEAADGEAAVKGVLATEPDITLLDIGMPFLNGLQAAQQILGQGSRTKILILSVYDSQDVVRQVIDSGARGYVLKSDAARDLIAAVEAVRSNETFFTPKAAEVILRRHLKSMYDGANTPAVGGKKRHLRP